MEINELPQVLSSLISSESSDFTLKAGAKRPFAKCAGEILFGLVFTSATFAFVSIYLSSRDTSESAAAAGTGSDTGLMVLFALFLGAGITIMIRGIARAFSRGGYFVGTPKRLICYKKGDNYSSFDWNRFSGDIQVRGNERKGTIRLFLRPENLSRAESESAYVPSAIYITSIQDPFEVEQMIRKRIKENDPAPARH